MNTFNNLQSKILATTLALLVSGSLLANDAPRLQFAIGDVKAIGLDGKIRPLKKGDVLLPGEKLVTKKGAMAQLRIFKQGVVVLRDDSQLELGLPVKGRYGVMLDKGMMRTVTKLARKTGKIDVFTPGVDIAVDAGDVLTGVDVVGNDKSTLNQVLDGKIKLTTSKQETVAQIGKVFQIAPVGGIIKEVKALPDVMKLTLPRPSTGVSAALDGKTVGAKTFSGDQGKVAAFNPARVTAKPAAARYLGPPEQLTKADVKSPLKLTYDKITIIDPRITAGSLDDQTAVNNALLFSLTSSISKTTNFVPVTTTDSAIRSDLTTKAQVVNLAPTISIGGETTLSSPLVPEVKMVVYEPTKIITTEPTYNPTLANTIKTTTKTTTLCSTCTKNLTLIRN